MTENGLTTRPQERDREQVARMVAAAQDGDRDAWCWLYRRFRPSVLAAVRRVVRDPHEAEDVTQQAFAKLPRAIARYSPRAGVPFAAWLLQLARNQAIDHLRRRRETLPDGALDDRPCEAPAPSALRIAIDALPRDQRDVIVLRHLVGLSPGEIAAHLGRSESSVHGLHHRGRVALRSELCRLGSGPSVRAEAAA
ncbi:MAG TPA: sigma-70 family RNA polymerase sigma factor [Conexibacter sp.]|nr:sigma-70 family RNA polymerase sigma factor [Conexibacter sp.]